LQISRYKKIYVSLKTERVSKILGYVIEENEIIDILRFLGIDLQIRDGVIFCTIPSWRNDIKEEIDLVEEIIRIKGYDSIPSPKQRIDHIYTPNNSLFSILVEEFRIRLKGLGFSEVLNYSFLEISELEKFDLKYYYKISNPISKEYEVLRSSLLPGLHKNLLLNIKQNFETITLFEYGKIFNEHGERKTFAGIMYGKVWQEWWKWNEQNINPKYDFYFGGGIIKNILSYDDEFIVCENVNPKIYYNFAKTAAIIYKKKKVGQFGILKFSISDHIKDDVFYFEIDLDPIESIYIKKHSFYKAYSKFPIIKRDISVIADKSLQFAKIEKIIKNVINSSSIFKEYSLFSVYTDESKLGDNKISYSFRLCYKNNKKTLTDEEVNEDMHVLLSKLDTRLGVKLR
jgi:phenylalanyl-tRNA synthetase beta chain